MDHQRTKPISNSDLMSSAKILADAAKSALSHESEKIDKAAVATATANVLGAAKKYGKLEEKSYGKYVDKAETYLHSYHSSSSPAAATTAAHGGHNGGYSGGGGHGHSSSGGGGGGSGGAGEYKKLAQGLLKKGEHGGGNGHSGGGGGSGDYIKLAQSLLKKH
ncbi:hypothetical protein RND81_02G215800 [Saponaria officinalis]|uniref:Nodulin-related protein 1 n=1 Tax=Saponaria officinalis TaxID=3572 RepID=A0AAW1MN50_SAPOF